jgi:hypothetical protein
MIWKKGEKNVIFGNFFFAHHKEQTQRFCLVWRTHYFTVFLLTLFGSINMDKKCNYYKIRKNNQILKTSVCEFFYNDAALFWFWRFAQTEIYRRKPRTIEEIMEIAEDVAQSIYEDLI